MKVLISAYACEPGRGSEPGVGWNWAVQASRHHEVWVLTRANNRHAIENVMVRSPNANLHFIYHDLPRWVRWWKRGNRGIHAYYLLWQLTGIRVARREHAIQRFDIGHHITLVTYRYPSLLAWLDLPFIWGPVAGAEAAPLAFYSTYGVKGALQQALRSVSNIATRLDPLVRRTRRRAALVLAATHETSQALHGAPIVPAVGTWLTMRSNAVHAPSDSGCIRLLYVGNLLWLKGLQLALPAIRRCVDAGVSVQFTIVGDGPERGALQDMCSGLGLDNVVEFRGSVPHAEVLKLYPQYDALLFPSMRDSGGFAILEAMEAQLPVICLAIGGPAEIVSDKSGIRIAALSPQQAVSDLSQAIQQLALSPEEREEMGRSARQRVEKYYAWERREPLIRQLYEQVGSNKP